MDLVRHMERKAPVPYHNLLKLANSDEAQPQEAQAHSLTTNLGFN